MVRTGPPSEKPQVVAHVDHGVAHSTMVLWVNGANAGKLTVRQNETVVLDRIWDALCERFGG